ncbi:hypothetical protein MOMA_01530 [Moraxella macacae 0408225]|uniref:Peptide chain release factor 2 n=1 Tax=Moraxella macacae 0408225 TaxID=1230338 RepID=L2F7L4_9GAMM|nr:hypothetical protein [Moraxella macacae]ELA09049.1 hypothetical protein MOMA_01530 [Moraxella macacae 0408225]
MQHFTKEANILEQEIDDLTETMHKVAKFRTLEEQVADMKRRGIEPSESYEQWDNEQDEDE